jgi:uncharacterized protein
LAIVGACGSALSLTDGMETPVTLRRVSLCTLLVALGVTCGCHPLAADEARTAFPDPKVTRLAEAVISDDGAAVTKLVREGADPSAAGKLGWSLLEYAAWRGDRSAFDALLAAGADTNHADSEGGTVMQYAVLSKDPTYLDKLLAHPVDPNLPNRVSGMTPLMRAAEFDHERQLHALIAPHANLDSVDRMGDTALMYAALSNSWERVIDLLHAGANPAPINSQHHTFQRYLHMTPVKVLSADAKKQLAEIDAWLEAHHVPVEK